jgi:hypothetical protein
LASPPEPTGLYAKSPRICSYVFSYRRMTRGELLTHSISYALIRAKKVVKGLSQSLTQDERQAVAQRAVDELRRNGDQWRLDEELPNEVGEVHSTPKKYTKE